MTHPCNRAQYNEPNKTNQKKKNSQKQNKIFIDIKLWPELGEGHCETEVVLETFICSGPR